MSDFELIEMNFAEQALVEQVVAVQAKDALRPPSIWPAVYNSIGMKDRKPRVSPGTTIQDTRPTVDRLAIDLRTKTRS